MKTLILGSTGFIGKNISSHFSEATCVDSKFHDFASGCGIDKFSPHDIIIDCVGRYGGLPYNKKHQENIFFQNSLININIKKLVAKIKPKRYFKIYGACMYPSVDHAVSEDLIEQNYEIADSVKWSALAQINDVKYLRYSNIPFDALIVTNCYGYHDHYDFEKSHIIGSLLKRISNGQQLDLIGTGIAKRDFMFADDLGKIIKLLIKQPCSRSVINVSSGSSIVIKDVVDKVVETYGYQGKINWGDSKDNGVLNKSLDNAKLLKIIGDFDFTTFDQGIKSTVKDFKQTQL